MHILDANEIFGTTFYTYDRIMELGGKNGPDAFALYVKFIKQSRIQETNQTKSLNTFLREGLGRGDERLKKARDVLKSLGLIDDLVIRDELGKIKGHYVRINFLINEDRVRSIGSSYNLSTTGVSPGVDKPQTWINSTPGQTDTNAGSTKYINAGSNYLSKDKCDTVAKNTQEESVDDFTQSLQSCVEDGITSPRDKEKSFYEVWNLIPTGRAGGNKSTGQKAFLKKLDEGFSVEYMKKCALLAKLELREKTQDYTYTMKKENWLTNLCKISDEEIDLRIRGILKARYERYLKGTKFKHNSVSELCDMFGSDYVNGLRKEIQKEYKQHF